MSLGKGATIGGRAFPYNPNSIEWGYSTNTNSTSTLGGRVVQILSVEISTLSWRGHAGSRKNLLNLYDTLYALMEEQSRTKNSHKLILPSRGWVFDVYIETLPSFGWDEKTVSYPYSIAFRVDTGHGSIYETLMGVELERLAEGIGYRPEWQSGASSLTEGLSLVMSGELGG